MARSTQLGEKGRRTRERLVVSGFSMFVREGVANVSLDDILRYSDVKKGAFYYYFDTKDEFLQACFEQCYLEPVAEALDGFRARGLTSLDDVLDFFTGFTVVVKDKMDQLLGEHAVELADVYSNIAYMSRESDFMAGHFTEFHEQQRALVQGCLEDMQRRGAVADDVSCTDLARLMCSCREGALTISTRGGAEFADTMARFMRYFEQLLIPARG